MTEIEKKAREIAESVIASRITPLIGKDYKGKIPTLKARIASVRAGTGDNLLEVEAARLGIIEGLEMAAKWNDGQSKIHDDYADQEWADHAAEKIYRRRANEHKDYAKQIRSITAETER